MAERASTPSYSGRTVRTSRGQRLPSPAGARYKGKITTWKDDQGFGFITPTTEPTSVFVHIKAFEKKGRRPVGNEIVTYDLVTDARGRTRAERVVFAGDQLPLRAPQKVSTRALAVVGLFFIVLAATAFSRTLPLVVLGFYLGVSAITFLLYGLDKSSARLGRWRTRESTLHFFGLIGGWPGALVAQTVLRHKSRKQPFKTVFWFTAVLNCGALVWFYSPRGSEALRAILGAT